MFTKKQKRINWILVAVLLVLSIFFLFPVIWMLANSFKPDAAITADMNSIAAFIRRRPAETSSTTTFQSSRTRAF